MLKAPEGRELVSTLLCLAAAQASEDGAGPDEQDAPPEISPVAVTPTAAGAAALQAFCTHTHTQAQRTRPRLLFASFEDEDEEDAPARGLRASEGSDRKEKSLGALCAAFLSHFSEVGVVVTPLLVAEQLGAKSRRIYDMLNVLETMGLLSRGGAGTYVLQGWAGLPAALQRIAASGATPPADDAVPAPLGPAGPESSLSSATESFVRALLAANGAAVDMSRGNGLGRRLYDVAAMLVTGLGLARKVSSGFYAWVGEAGRAVAAAAPPSADAGAAGPELPSPPVGALPFPELAVDAAPSPSLKRGREADDDE